MNPGNRHLAEVYFQPVHKDSLWERVFTITKLYRCDHAFRLTHVLGFLLNNKLLLLLLLPLLQVRAALTYKEPVWIGGCSVLTSKFCFNFGPFVAYLFSCALALKAHTALLNSVTAKIPPPSSSNSFLMNEKITSDIRQLLQALHTVHVGNHEVNNILDHTKPSVVYF